MKTTILLFVFVLLYVSLLHAQIEKGRVQVGGNVGFSHLNYNDSLTSFKQKSTTLTVSPTIGVFYKTNRLYGAFLNFGYYSNAYNSQSVHIIRSYGGGIFFRQYQPIIKKLYLLFDERASFNYQTYNATFHTSHISLLNASFQTGMAYDIAKKMQLELLLNNLLNASYTHLYKGNSYGISTSLDDFTLSNIAFGFRYYLK